MELKIKFDEKMLVETANRVLDEFEYNGKTIREWADLLANQRTNADRIRAMTDEEMAEWIKFVSAGCDYMFPDCPAHDSCKHVCLQNDACRKGWLDWLKQEVEDED